MVASNQPANMRTVAVAALIASASAFSPMMSVGRQEVVRSAAAAAVAAPLLRSNPAAAKMDKSNKAPEIVIMDHRGCSRKAGGEYTGAKAGDMNDEMCVKVSMSKVEGGSLNALSLLKK
ncbi:MAG: hypothetical protein ACPIOQ_18225 [Promethearchaeia archaeon]